MYSTHLFSNSCCSKSSFHCCSWSLFFYPPDLSIHQHCTSLCFYGLRSEIPSGVCAELRTVAASNNRDHPTRSLSSSQFASTINCSPGSQALLEVTHQDHTIGITLLLLLRATYIMVLFFTHIPFVVNHTINATPPERLQQPSPAGVCCYVSSPNLLSHYIDFHTTRLCDFYTSFWCLDVIFDSTAVINTLIKISSSKFKNKIVSFLNLRVYDASIHFWINLGT